MPLFDPIRPKRNTTPQLDHAQHHNSMNEVANTIDALPGNGVPSTDGGEPRDALQKASSINGDVRWETFQELPPYTDIPTTSERVALHKSEDVDSYRWDVQKNHQLGIGFADFDVEITTTPGDPDRNGKAGDMVIVV
jgi:hypothetical protein